MKPLQSVDLVLLGSVGVGMQVAPAIQRVLPLLGELSVLRKYWSGHWFTLSGVVALLTAVTWLTAVLAYMVRIGPSAWGAFGWVIVVLFCAMLLVVGRTASSFWTVHSLVRDDPDDDPVVDSLLMKATAQHAVIAAVCAVALLILLS